MDATSLRRIQSNQAKELAPKLRMDKTVPGGLFIVDGNWVNASGKILGPYEGEDFLDDDVDEEDFEDPDAVPTTPPPPALQPNRQPARRAATNGDGPKETDPPKTGGEDPKTGGEDPKTGGEDPDAKANDPEK